MGIGRALQDVVSPDARAARTAQKTLETAQAEQARYEAQAAAKQAELEDLRRRATADLIAAGDDGDAVAAKLAQSMQALELSIGAYRSEAANRADLVQEAQKDLVRARATDLRTAAAGLRAEADKRQAKTDDLLAALKAHEGADYMPWRFDPEDPEYLQRKDLDAPAYQIARTTLLLDEAVALEAEAAALEASVARPVSVPTAAPVGVRLQKRPTEETRGKPVQEYAVPPEYEAVAHFKAHVTPGDGGPHMFALHVDGVEVDSIRLDEGEHLLHRLLGNVPLPAPVEIVGFLNGEVVGHRWLVLEDGRMTRNDLAEV